MPKKIKMISNSNNTLYALCLDGSLWEYSVLGSWEKLPDIPGNDDNVKKDPKKRFGVYKNVKLTEKEYAQLKEKFGEYKLSNLIDKLDKGIELKGYKYSSHNLAILTWAEREIGSKTNGSGLVD